MSSDSPVAGGGFGDIYRGVLNNGAEVSLKCVRLEVELDDGGQRKVKDAARELYIWSKCKHPNVLELMGVTQHRGQIAMVSPWMGNGDLTRFLTAHPEVDRYDLCAQIADGVAYLHQESVIHGDIKGANILVSEDHTPKITDFGTASRIDCTLQFTETSGSQHMSIYWTAPEIINESLDKGTAEADVFSLGMTILEVFTGTAPFTGMHPVAAMKKITDGVHPVRPEKHIPSGEDRADLLWSLLVDCWAFRPQDRPTASDVKYRMKAIARI
ncbi:Tyrosine-protein kinase Fer [Rhizoctonia solani AG-1 IB]|uniref:Tyrosine-protein kinase Fer n=1 Tax=Thanatephorus cucumeris (strain AG1-IB / isolate 7/3/14) TaxID=1108050 RepID=M5CCH1_THACB|nr:Tyrosine-protein kinase Fer [Rhizoctonia solani AG-1 IB]